MPRLVRLYIKAALIHFVLALAAGLLLVIQPSLPDPLRIAGLTPVYFHLLMVGWVTQLIFGVAYWMFPRYSKDSMRGHEPLAWISLFLLNAGLILRAIGEPMLSTESRSIAAWLLGASALCQLVAGWSFVINIWPRVRER